MHARLSTFTALAGGLLSAAALLACGSSGQTDAASASGAGGFVTGAGGSASDATTSTGLPPGKGDATTGSGGGRSHKPKGERVPYPIVLAHGFFGFNDFAGLDFETYFYQVKTTLAKQGITVYTPEVDPFNTSDVRGKELLEAIEPILKETGAKKVDIIGHSQGGLDARVVANLRPDLVAAIVTVGTPHQGTPVADVLLDIVSDPNAQDAIDEIVQLVGKPLWDKEGNQSSVFLPLKLFSQSGIAAFNTAHPDEHGVFYASVAGRSNLQSATDDCKPDALMPFIAPFGSTLDPIDPLLSVTGLICSDGIDDVANDGLVPVSSARWGQFWGCVPADHLDEVGQLLGDSPGAGNDWDYMAFYSSVIRELRDLGY